MATPPDATTPTRGLPPEIGERLSPERRAVAVRCLSLIGVLAAGSLIGVAFWPYLVTHLPLLLIALSPIGRHLILVAPVVDPYVFVLVAVVRRLAFYVPCFYLGRALGSLALGWLETRAPFWARALRWLERLFKRASWPVVFLLPGPAMSTIAGDAGMRAPIFLSLLTAGLVLRMLILIWLGEWLREPIEWLLEWLRSYWLPATLVMVAGMGIYQWIQQRRQRSA